MNRVWHQIPRSCSKCRSWSFSSFSTYQPLRPSVAVPESSPFHSSGIFIPRRRHDHFASKAPTIPPQVEEPPGKSKRKSTRSSAAQNSLRRVAVEAQRSRDRKDAGKFAPVAPQTVSKTVTAICAAEEYDIAHVARILQGVGHELDPYKTDLYPQVVHVALPVQTNPTSEDQAAYSTGDLFVFPSGTVVAWAVPDNVILAMVSKALLPAAKYPVANTEEEDMEYFEDPKREYSSIKGDRIILGTRTQLARPGEGADTETLSSLETESGQNQSRNLDTVLAKIAFSSGLARSTKLAVLESLLNDYQESTRSIPTRLSRGGRMPFTRSFISQKTGQLLSIRGQLNLYSELTDSLPDLFWDSRHELGLEGYYDQVGKALDINIRIKVLNQKMDYSQEIASVLRQHLSEAHGVRLEWIIIALIAVEVFFALQREVKEYREKMFDGGQRINGHQVSDEVLVLPGNHK